jgi:hypothetical protein
MVNQRQFIGDIYGVAAGAVITVDAYTPLIQRQNQYIYYRTENNLTALGGFYAYSAMLRRMALGEAELSRFNIDYFSEGYFGDLAREAGRSSALADEISLFRYGGASAAPLEFMVTHTDAATGETKTYHSLYPEEAARLGQPLDIFLGGLSSITDIASSKHLAAKVLVFGDETALSYAPFLAADCSRVTVVDLADAPENLSRINPAEYDKVVFAYSVESFMHTNYPARAALMFR